MSRDGLFGLTGQVVFPVSAASGRIHIYDEHGTLHDEMCRWRPVTRPLPKAARGWSSIWMLRAI